MSQAKLILFFNQDYIIPVVDKGDGAYDGFHGSGDGRLWLYFYVPADSSRLEASQSNKSMVLCKRPGYIGHFWDGVVDGRKYSTTTVSDLPYLSLLDNSGIIERLRRFYAEPGRPEVSIPTVYIFARNIPEAARKAVIAHMEDKSFATQSFSVTPEDLTIGYMRYTRPELKPEFGQKIVFCESSGSDLLMGCYAYDGQQFLPTDDELSLGGLGENPLRRSLAQIVLSTMQRSHNFLREDEIERELEYQMQFVDNWLEKRHDPTFGIQFHYSRDTSVVYPCIVDNTVLKSRQEQAISELVQKIVHYRDRVARHDMLQCVLSGEAFSDNEFVRRVTDNIGNRQLVSVITPDRMPDVLARYSVMYGDMSERLENFDNIANIRRQARKAIAAWIRSAERIRALDSTVRRLADTLESRFKPAEEACRRTDSAVRRHLAAKGGKFDDARRALTDGRPQNDAMADYMIELRRCRGEIDECRALFEETGKFEGARRIIDNILSGANRLGEIEARFAALDKAYAELGATIDRYEEVYPEYCTLIKQFERERNVNVRKKIIREITERDLTPCELPVVELDELVPVKLSATVEKIKTGWFGKKFVLHVTASLPDGVALPCRAVLLVQDKPLVRIDEAYIVGEYDKGDTGPFTYDHELPLAACKNASKLNVYFVPHPEETIGINNAFITDLCSVSL